MDGIITTLSVGYLLGSLGNDTLFENRNENAVIIVDIISDRVEL